MKLPYVNEAKFEVDVYENRNTYINSKMKINNLI